jgi:hypothetical protein
MFSITTATTSLQAYSTTATISVMSSTTTATTFVTAYITTATNSVMSTTTITATTSVMSPPPLLPPL